MAGDRMRDEAERLVAAAIAAVSYAARGFGTVGAGPRGFATGSPECCVCPVCRAIAAVREPSPELADRLASGVGDLAAGVTSLLRTLSRAGARAAPPEEPVNRDGDEFWESLRRKAADAAKAAAARATSTVDGQRKSTVDDDPWRVATAPDPVAAPPRRPVMAKKAVASKGVPAQPAAGPTAGPATVARKAVAKKAVAKKAVAKKAVAKKAVAKKAVAKKAVAKKAVAKKAAPRRGIGPEGGA